MQTSAINHNKICCGIFHKNSGVLGPFIKGYYHLGLWIHPLWFRLRCALHPHGYLQSFPTLFAHQSAIALGSSLGVADPLPYIIGRGGTLDWLPKG